LTVSPETSFSTTNCSSILNKQARSDFPSHILITKIQSFIRSYEVCLQHTDVTRLLKTSIKSNMSLCRHVVILHFHKKMLVLMHVFQSSITTQKFRKQWLIVWVTFVA